MQFNVLERFVLLDTLPKENNYAMLKAMRELKEALSFTGEECQEIDFKPMPDGKVSWDMERGNKLGEKEIEIPVAVIAEMQRVFKDLDSKKKLQERHVSLYDKFMEVK